MKIKENDKIPNAEVFILENGEPIKKNIEEFLKNKKVIIFGLPGAYTSVCSTKHLPGYVRMYDNYKNKGINQIICISVNDPFVMAAWGKSHNVYEKITMLGDSRGEFTKSIGAELDLNARGLGIRYTRYTMLVENGTVKKFVEEEAAGKCEITSATNFLKKI